MNNIEMSDSEYEDNAESLPAEIDEEEEEDSFGDTQQDKKKELQK